MKDQKHRYAILESSFFTCVHISNAARLGHQVLQGLVTVGRYDGSGLNVGDSFYKWNCADTLSILKLRPVSVSNDLDLAFIWKNNAMLWDAYFLHGLFNWNVRKTAMPFSWNHRGQGAEKIDLKRGPQPGCDP